MSVSAVQRKRLIARAARDVEGLAEIFKVLADPTRLRILVTLVEGGELCVHEICARVGMSQPAVSHQLRTLRGARLVRSRRAGREIHYALDDDHVVTLLSEGLHHAGHGAPLDEAGGRTGGAALPPLRGLRPREARKQSGIVARHRDRRSR